MKLNECGLWERVGEQGVFEGLVGGINIRYIETWLMVEDLFKEKNLEFSRFKVHRG
ncbi:hypothetical protein D3C73_1630430 [compost metagenome]